MALSPAATQFPFLQHGKPFFDAEDFKRLHSSLRHYKTWEAVVYVGRTWCMSVRKDKIRPPVALTVFGVSEKDEDSSSSISHHLLFATVLEDAKPLTITEELTQIFNNCPPFYRPTTVEVSYYSQVQHTLDFVRGVRGSKVSQQVVDVLLKEKYTTTNYFVRTVLKEQQQQSASAAAAAPSSAEDVDVLDITPFSPPFMIAFNVKIRQSEVLDYAAAKDTYKQAAAAVLSENTAADSAAAAVSVAPFTSDALTASSSSSSSSPQINMDQVAEWMFNVREMFPDASMMPFTNVAITSAANGNSDAKADASAAVDDAASPCCTVSSEAATNAINDILLMGATFPQLSTMRVAPPPPQKKKPTSKLSSSSSAAAANKKESTKDAAATAGGGAITKAAKAVEEADKKSLMNRLVCGTFTVPEAYLNNNKYPHVLLLQRPSIVGNAGDNSAAAKSGSFANSETAAAAASEGIEVGPVQPQPIGLELHLHADPGDAAYVADILTRPFNVQMYEDLLHPDGEVYVQFGPVEGAAVCDAEAAIRAFDHVHHAGEKKKLYGEDEAFSAKDIHWGFTAEGTSVSAAPILRPVGSNDKSNFYVPVPRVVFNAPTGKMERRTPLEAAKTTLSSSSPNAEMLVAAAAALTYFTAELMVVVKRDEASADSSSPTVSAGLSADFFEINWPKVALDISPRGADAIAAAAAGGDVAPTTLFTCNFCRRQRLKMMRCGGCKVTSYCCKDHQLKDWKGAHKGECKLLKVADEEFKASLLSAINDKKQQQKKDSDANDTGADAEENVFAEDDSNALTFVRLLEQCRMSALPSTSSSAVDSAVDEALLAKIKANNAKHLADVEKSNGGSGANTKQKAEETAADSSSTTGSGVEVINVHLLNVEDAFGFMEALARWYNSNNKKMKNDDDGKRQYQYRIVMANSASIKAADQNKVFAMSVSSDNSFFSEVEPSGVLGDVWRAEGNATSAAATAPFLVRLYHDRYHNAAEKLFGSARLIPHVVLSVGPRTTEGQSFFNASTEVFADDVLGKVCFGFAEPHYMAAHRTMGSLNNRIALSPVNKAPAFVFVSGADDAAALDLSTATPSALSDQKAGVNAIGVCPVPIKSEVSSSADSDDDGEAVGGGDAAEGPAGVATCAVPLHLNAYAAVMIPLL